MNQQEFEATDAGVAIAQEAFRARDTPAAFITRLSIRLAFEPNIPDDLAEILIESAHSTWRALREGGQP